MLNKIQKIRRIHDLVLLLNNACHAYYNLNSPIMENREYNILFDELKLLESELNVTLSNSPTQRAGYKVVSNLPKVKHDIPLLSLDKVKEISKLIKWLGDKQGVLMLKIDGGTGKVTYQKTFKQLVTRGDSETNIGEDISHNVNSIKNIPLAIDDEEEIQVVGENFMRYSSFNELNSKIKNPDERYANPRNLANGSVGLLDSKVCKERNIEFCAFNIIKGNKFETKLGQLEWLKSQGFDVVKYWIVDKNNLEEIINKIIEDIPSFDYPIDGLVLTFNDISYAESLGKTNHHYNGSISFKFEDSWHKSKYLYTEWNTSRFGKIVGTGIFQPVNIEGTEVTRATTHNLDRFWQLKLGKSDVVEISKRNKIIPAIENNITRSGTEEIPTECPTCKGKVEIRKVVNTHDLFCLNPDCDAKLLKKLKHFVSKQCFNISDIGEASLEVFIDKGFINCYMDIFKLEKFKKEIISISGFGIRSFNKMITAIENSKNIKMCSLIASLGIKNVGFGSAKRLEKHFNSDINDFLNAVGSYRNFIGIEDFGETTAMSIYSYFQDKDNMEQFKELLSVINVVKEEEKKDNVNTNNFFSGKKVYCTGTFANYKKDELKKLLESLGAEFTLGYAKSLDYLVVGGIKGSTKTDKAIKDGIQVIGEDEFIRIVNQGY